MTAIRRSPFRLSQMGYHVGIRMIDALVLRERGFKREVKLLNVLIFIKSTVWKVTRSQRISPSIQGALAPRFSMWDNAQITSFQQPIKMDCPTLDHPKSKCSHPLSTRITVLGWGMGMSGESRGIVGEEGRLCALGLIF